MCKYRNTKLSAGIVFALFSLNSPAWELEVVPDNMTGKTQLAAVFESKNAVKLVSPYGKITPRLVIRKHPRYGRDVIFFAGDGQILCRSYSPCSVLVKFDERKPVRFTGTPPSDGSTSTVFIQGYSRFVDEFVKSKSVIVEVEFYRNGHLNFEFDVAGFKKEAIK